MRFDELSAQRDHAKCVLSPSKDTGVRFDELSAQRVWLLTVTAAGPLAEAMSALLTDSEVSQRLAGLANWRRAASDDPTIAATYEFTDFVAALDFVNQVGHEAELMNHHPDIDIRWNKVTLVLSTHSEGGLTQNDFELAHRINEVTGQEA